MTEPADERSEKDVRDAADPRSPDRMPWFYRNARRLFTALSSVGFDFKAYGVDRVPQTGGVLIAANHQSYLDPPLYGLPLRRPAAFLAKSELFENPAFARVIRALNAFPVRQGAGDVSAMRESIRLLQAGWAVTVFPEGSRTPDGELQPAQKGAGLMVKRAGVPVVPAVIHGSHDAWPRGTAMPRPGVPIRVLYGEPADLGVMKADDVRKWLDDRLAALFDDLRSGRV